MESLLLTTFGEVIKYILYILIAILVLLVMITVHEFGHFITGKFFGFGIEEFSIGFGPKIFGQTKKNGEKFSLRLIPLGGYCAFKGEDAEDEDPTAFNNKKPWQRIIVLVSGALMNYLLAVVCIMIMFGVYGTSAIVITNPSTDFSVYSQEESFHKNDIIIEADGKNIYLVTDLMNILDGKKKGDIIKFNIKRNGEFVNANITIRADANFSSIEDTEGLSNTLGVLYERTEDNANIGFATTGIKRGFFKTIGRSFQYSFKLACTIFTIIHQLFTGKIGINSLGGTVTTISTTANAIKNGGLWSLLNISALIGVNLALFNLLPIPALDGARVVFVLIEWIIKKPINRKIEGIIHTVGFLCILLFAIFVDLQQCF